MTEIEESRLESERLRHSANNDAVATDLGLDPDPSLSAAFVNFKTLAKQAWDLIAELCPTEKKLAETFWCKLLEQIQRCHIEVSHDAREDYNSNDDDGDGPVKFNTTGEPQLESLLTDGRRRNADDTRCKESDKKAEATSEGDEAISQADECDAGDFELTDPVSPLEPETVEGNAAEQATDGDDDEVNDKRTGKCLVEAISKKESCAFACHECSQEFPDKTELKSHTKTAHPIVPGKRRYKCSQCDKTCSTMGNLNVHSRVHSGERPFPCPKCSTRFSSGGNLRRHLLSHQGLKPYRCSVCDSCFTEKKSLLMHARTHTGDRPLQCPNCDKRFSDRTTLRGHLKSIHSTARPHLCQSCNKLFKTNAHLRTHEKRVHSGLKEHVCQCCDAAFAVKGDLDRHIKSHSNKREFVCERCGKSFTRQSSLADHLIKHLSLEPFQCPHCDRKFSDRSLHRRHILKYHKSSTNTNPVIVLS